jgi:hypothetical protein
VVVAAAVYIAYSALSLRRALVDGPYRTRALWTAVGAVSVISFIAAGYVDVVFGQTPTTIPGVVAEDAVWGFTFLAIYGWVVTNANVAIRADFFNRDALKWKGGGSVAAPAAILVTYAFISVPPWWFPAWLTQSALVSGLISFSFAAVVVYASAVLAITYRRINDRRVKDYTKWVVLSTLSLFLLAFLPYSYLEIALAFAWVYCMYRSVGSLAIKTRKLEPS